MRTWLNKTEKELGFCKCVFFRPIASKSKTSFFFFIGLGRECLFTTRHKSCHKLRRNTFYDFYFLEIVFVKDSTVMKHCESAFYFIKKLWLVMF